MLLVADLVVMGVVVVVVLLAAFIFPSDPDFVQQYLSTRSKFVIAL
jgi:hypothetical protein